MCGKQLKISNIRVFRQFLCERALLIFVRCMRVTICLQFLFLFYTSDLIPIDMHDDMLTLLNIVLFPTVLFVFTLLLSFYPYSAFRGI